MTTIAGSGPGQARIQEPQAGIQRGWKIFCEFHRHFRAASEVEQSDLEPGLMEC